MIQKQTLNFRQLEIFLKVAELGSFTKAAQALFLTQPAVSWQIKNLEEELDLILLERGDRQIALTEAGEFFYRDAKRLLNLYQKTLEDMEEYRGLGFGSLNLGGSTIPGEYFLPRFIGEFKERYPSTKISLTIGDTGAIAEKLIDDEIQLGIIGAQLEENKLELTPFLKDELILIASPHHPWAKRNNISIGELGEGLYISREEDSGTKMVIEQELAKVGIDLRDLQVAIQLGSPRAVISGVAAGLGLAWVSGWSAQDALKLGYIKAISVKGFRVERSFYLATRTNRHLSPLTKAFLSFLLESI